MSTFKIAQNQTSTYNITGSNNIWILKQGVQISSMTDGISEPSVLNNNSYVIDGKVLGLGVFSTAMSLAGDNANVEIGSKGELSGKIGIKSLGDNAKISNSGVISADTAGVEIHGSHSSMVNHGGLSSSAGAALSVLNVDRFSFVNDGEMSGVRGIYSEATDLSVKLGKHSVIETSGTTIESLTELGDTAHIVNKGALSSDGNIFSLVIDGRDGEETIRNSGTIDGSLSLGGGDDRYDGRGGSVSGVIAGGLGADTYWLSSKNDYVREVNGEGFDTLKTSFSFRLGNDQSIEMLQLIGKGNFNLHGNDSDNALAGNSGRNHLFSEAGSDSLSGGQGRDFLTGGDGNDMFVFYKGADKEIVTDFTDGVDKIYFALGTHDISSIKDALAHHTHQVGDDVVISGDGTEMIIRNFDRANLTADDFYS